MTPLPRCFADFDQPDAKRDQAVAVEGARVVLADYDRLRADFPALGNYADPELDAWLLENAACVSLAQTGANEVNTSITTRGEPREVLRPPRYGRALVVEASGPEGEPIGLLDLKGAGARSNPSHASHASGLMLLSEALADYLMRELLAAVFRHAGVGFRCLPVYAILDLGFDFTREGRRTALGMQVRQAHRRRRGGIELPARGDDEQLVKFEIELLLRQYGITSCNRGTHLEVGLDERGQLSFRYSNHPVDLYTPTDLAEFAETIGLAPGDVWEGINIQNTREVSRHPSRATLVDFGHYECRPRFTLPLASLVNDRVMRWGGGFNLDHPYFMQPRPELAVPLEDWGRSDPREREVFAPFPGVRYDRPGLRGYIWALRWRAGEWGPTEIRAALDELLATTEAAWSQTPRTATAG